MMPLRGLFITGTDTGVGKTRVASAIIVQLRAQQIRVGAYKPAASGAELGPDGPVWTDVERLSAALHGEYPAERICPQRFEAPLAPPVAARLEDRNVDAALLRTAVDWWRERVEVLIVEGAGGLLSPLSDADSNADLAADLGFPLVIVARRTLGTINHTLLTLEAAARRDLSVAGVILNNAAPVPADDLSARSNADELARRTQIPILASLPYVTDLKLDQVHELSKVDFEKLAKTDVGQALRGAD